jgi:hypothetical protein
MMFENNVGEDGLSAESFYTIDIGRIAVLWRLGHQDFEVEVVHVPSPNILTFQLVTGGVPFFVMGVRTSPLLT